MFTHLEEVTSNRSILVVFVVFSISDEIQGNFGENEEESTHMDHGKKPQCCVQCLDVKMQTRDNLTGRRVGGHWTDYTAPD